ncbi:hypothetical protein ACLKA6_002380 [Drosophila palustris]
MMPFTVITDHASLQWAQRVSKTKRQTGEVVTELQAFPFSMRYKKGADNVVADTLSRSVEELEVTPEDLLGFETLEFESTAYQELVNEVISQEQRLPGLESPERDAVQEDGTCSTRGRSGGHKKHTQKRRLLMEAWERLYTRYKGSFFTVMVIQVRDYVRKCEVCKETKAQITGCRSE